MPKFLTRRSVLRGSACGAAITVGVPFLDCFLNDNGTALAATGQALPVTFGTWWQGLGFNPGRWIPTTTGPGYQHVGELKVFDGFRDRMNIISGTKYLLDGRPLETHTSGYQIASTGALTLGNTSGPSLDSQIADVVGTRSRFRSLEIAIGGGRQSFSKRAGAAQNPSEPSPEALYKRIYGPEFKDPNAAEFTPDAVTLARRSVLSAVKEERLDLAKQLSTADRTRLDEYFTSLRQLEQQLSLEMQKPEPLPACRIPEQVEATKVSPNIPDAEKNGKLMGRLVAHAIACGQTRVVNVALSSNGLHRIGTQQTWHTLTHEEAMDEKLGYQPEVTWFINWANARFVDYLTELDSIKEGPGSVLDRMAIVWQTDHSNARNHSIEGLPILTVGRAGGRLKTGIHVSMLGDPATRVGLTLQQMMGVPIKSWGGLSNETSKTVTEILA